MGKFCISLAFSIFCISIAEGMLIKSSSNSSLNQDITKAVTGFVQDISKSASSTHLSDKNSNKNDETRMKVPEWLMPKKVRPSWMSQNS